MGRRNFETLKQALTKIILTLIFLWITIDSLPSSPNILAFPHFQGTVKPRYIGLIGERFSELNESPD